MRIKNLTSSQLADAIGVQRSGISHFVSGRNKPSLEFVLKIIHHFPDVNPDWLLMGSGPIFRNSIAQEPVENPEFVNKDEGFLSAPLIETDFQPSLLDELFNVEPEPKKPDNSQDKRINMPKRESHPQSEKKIAEDRDLTKIENQANPAENREEVTAERIVIFYSDRTFREYSPS
ncbi:MAG: helix-turn-helix transcriptional regulator [Bacteroidota bacterium]